MADDRFIAFRQELFALHTAGSYAPAIQLLAEQGRRFPDRQDDIYFWKACFFALVDQPAEAIDALERGLEDGYWWKPEFLTTEPDLDCLHGQPAFERLLEASGNRYKTAKKGVQAKLHSFLPPMSAPIPYPVILAMHGRDMDPMVTCNYWKAATEWGCFVGVPQSSQISGMNRFEWDDEKKTLREIKSHLEDVLHEPAIARNQLILGGFAQGGQKALHFALQGIGDALGFIAVGPSINDEDIEQIKPIIEQADTKSLRGYIITGDHDPNRTNILQFHRMLQHGGIACELEEQPDLGNDYPIHFKDSLKQAIGFILQR